jgi:hypothetical protein
MDGQYRNFPQTLLANIAPEVKDLRRKGAAPGVRKNGRH